LNMVERAHLRQGLIFHVDFTQQMLYHRETATSCDRGQHAVWLACGFCGNLVLKLYRNCTNGVSYGTSTHGTRTTHHGVEMRLLAATFDSPSAGTRPRKSGLVFYRYLPGEAKLCTGRQNTGTCAAYPLKYLLFPYLSRIQS
jgi:hypothetical protein